MKTILDNIKNQLSSITSIGYLDNDYGQLDYYSDDTVIEFPLVLLDIAQVQFSDIGRDINAAPQNRQRAEAQLTVTVANLHSSNAGNSSSGNQQPFAAQIWLLMEEIHAALHGFAPGDRTSALTRLNLQRYNMDNGMQVYKVNYVFNIENI